MARKPKEQEVEPVASVEETVRKVLAEENAPKAKAFNYPELENENFEVLRFGKGTSAEHIYNQLASEKKVFLFIPKEFGGSNAPKQRYQNGGLIMWITKGVMVEVPKTVSDDLTESINLTEKALDPIITNLSTGEKVHARLDKTTSSALNK